MSLDDALRRWQCVLQLTRNVVRLVAIFIERELPQITFNHPEWVETSLKVYIVQKTEVVYHYAMFDLFVIQDPTNQLQGCHILYKEERDIALSKGVVEILQVSRRLVYYLGC